MQPPNYSPPLRSDVAFHGTCAPVGSYRYHLLKLLCRRRHNAEILSTYEFLEFSDRTADEAAGRRSAKDIAPNV